MAKRVTNLETTDSLVQNIFERRLALEKVRTNIASGVKIAVASEDPGKSGTILNLQATAGRIERHKERIAFATGILEHQESTVDSADSIMVRAKEIATQGANETLSYRDRQLLAEEVFQLRDALVSLANTTFQGRYLYGAADDDDPPFDAQTYTESPLDPTKPSHYRYVYDAETGTSLTRNVLITDDDSIKLNSRGDLVFSGAIGAIEQLGRSLAGYRTTLNGTTNLPTGAGTAYTQPADYKEQTHDILTALDRIEVVRNNDLIVERSSIGARVARLEQVTDILDNLKTTTESSRSALQDTDLFDASARFSNLQISLEALLASSAQINNLTLLNYI